MSQPRFRPRDYVGAKEFGKVWDPTVVHWRVPSRRLGGSRDFLWASVVQHVHSLTIRAALREKQFKSMTHLCTARSLPYERLTGMLRGDDILRVEDMGLFVLHLGPAAVPEPALVERAIAAAARKTRYKRKV